MRLLDSQDMSVNADQPLLAGLTNAGPANLGIPMNMPAAEIPSSNVGIFGTPPPLMQSLETEDDDEFNDTDPMSFEDDQIFEYSPFLGIRIGKKAKARGQAKRVARVQKKIARRAAKAEQINSIGKDSVWNTPSEITPEKYNPLAAVAQAETPAMLSVVNDASNTLSAQKLGIAPAANIVDEEQGYTPEDSPEAPKKEKKSNNTLMYLGIGVAVIALVYFIKNKK